MADRNFDRERRWRDRDYDRDWEPTSRRGQFNRDYDYDQDWDQGFNRGSFNRGQFNRGSNFDRDWDLGYNRAGYNRSGFNRSSEFGQDWDRDYGRTGFNRSQYDRGFGQRSDFGTRTGRNYGQDWDTGFDQPSYLVYEEWWLIPGPFTGVGPKGYQRSDDRIRDDIHERLTQHGQLDASDIQVDVRNGEVTLHGMVNSRRDKRIAEDIAESVHGVSDVHNQLRLQQTGMQTGMQGSRMPGSNLRSQIREGMEVVGRNGERIGKVKDVRQNDFLVDRDMARDVYVPFSACISAQDRIMLNVTANEVDNQNWEAPEVIGSETQGSRNR